MKEKRRITSDGYFEVSKDGGSTWTKTSKRPTTKEMSEWQSFRESSLLAKPEDDEFIVPGTPKRQMSNITPLQTDEYAKMQLEGKSTGATPFEKNLSYDKTVAPKKDNSGAIENILASAQAGYGLQQLLKDKRPIGQIDPAFSKLTDEAIDASRYGFTPQQRAALNQDIVNNRIAQQQRINQLAGGSASVGLTNVRAALNEELMNKYKLAAQDEQMRIQKLQDAAGLAGTRAQTGRQLFADKMIEFMQNQQAGAELLGAGIQNLVGAQRYKREKMAQDQINKMMYGNTNLG